jgi:hypothetical protein
MVILRRIIVQAAVVLAAACTRGAKPASIGDTSAAAPSTTPATTSAPPSAKPATPTVTERGLGPLRAGMSFAEASAALGGALVVPSGADTAACDYVEWRGGPPGVQVMVEEGRIARVDVDTVGVATAAGAQVGDSEERIQSLYRGRVVVSPHHYEEGHYLTVSDPADTTFAIVFEAAKGRVTRYRAGRRPQVEYVEGCA